MLGVVFPIVPHTQIPSISAQDYVFSDTIIVLGLS